MYQEFEFRLCHLHRVRWVGRKRMWQWLKLDPTLNNMYNLNLNDLQTQFSFPRNQAIDVLSDLHSSELRFSVEKDLRDFNVLLITHSNYPVLLKQIPDPPLLLYMWGNPEILTESPKITVIGTRNYSNEAAKKVDFLLEPLIKQNWVIVSGMAKGVDTMAHKAAIYYQGKTIGVLGFGFHHIYPKENAQLMKHIRTHHLLVSEYPPNMPPRKWHFPERNRIISGLSFGSLIIEAKERSGTFITAEQALEQGREVFVVPGSIFLPQTAGCHLLLKEGAELITDSKDIIESWNTRRKTLNFL